MKTGWISIHRKIQDHWIYEKKRPRTKYEAWIDILLEVNHKTQKVLIGNDLISCRKGQSLKSLNTWAKQWKWNKSKVRRFFTLLQKDNMIVSEGVQNTTRLSVINYEPYQNERNESETQVKRKCSTPDTPATPNNNDNNENNVNKKRKSDKYFLSFLPDELNNNGFIESWKEWIEYRKEIKKALKESTAKKQLKFLLKQLDAIACIDQTIEKGWTGLFEIKNIGVNNARKQSTAAELAKEAEERFYRVTKRMEKDKITGRG
jgi:hypothetical protein